MQSYHHRFRFAALIVSVILFAGAVFLQNFFLERNSNFVRITVFAKRALQQEEEKCNLFLEKLSAAMSAMGSGNAIADSIFKKVEKPQDNFTYFIYSSDSLNYWSDNNIYFPYDQLKQGINQQLIQLKNGWYELFKKSSGKTVVVGLLLIKNQYSFQNKYLRNEFNSFLNLPSHAQLVSSPRENTFPVVSSNGNYLFSIQYHPEDNDPGSYYLIAFLYFLAFAFFTLTVYFFARSYSVKQPWISFLLLGILVALRWKCIEFHYPQLLYNTPLFNPLFFASSFFLASLGDFLLSSIVFAAIVLFIYQFNRSQPVSDLFRNNKFLLSLSVIFSVLITFLFSVFVNYLLSGLIINSKISFNVNNIFELTFFSAIGFLITGILLFTFYIVCEGAVRFAQKTSFGPSFNFLLFLITQGIFLAILIWLRDTEIFINYGVSTFLLTNFLILFTGYIRFTSKRSFSFGRSILIILGFSLYAAQTIYEFNQRKDKDNLRLLVNKVENQQDLIAEYLFEEIERKISADEYLTTFFTNNQTVFQEEKIKKRILLSYFNEVYWSRYEIRLHAFNNSNFPVFQLEDTNRNYEFYENLIATEGRPTYSKGFYYLASLTGKTSYIGKINFKNPGGTYAGSLFIELDSKFFRDEGGFPDLLISDKMSAAKDISSYSYARYNDGRLVHQYGKFTYFMNPATYEKIYGELRKEKFETFAGYTHLFYKYGDGDMVIVSHRNPTWLESVTLFSYVFTFLTLLFIAAFLIIRLVKDDLRYQLDFRKRIQFSVIAVVIAALLLIGGGTIYYIVQGYSSEQKVRINERLSLLLVAIENELAGRQNLSQQVIDEMAPEFSKLAGTMGSDFNLYDKNGHLVFSTQPKIFDQEIISHLMNRRAFDQLANYQNNDFIHLEEIGKLSFLSAYQVVRNGENKTIGYLNLPYLTRQNELKKEISSFLVTLINIYVLLFAISVFLTFIISNRLVKPLNVIQEKLGNIKLGKSNELIDWDAKDEIGALVNEYNKMVDQLAESAVALAQSERESAWREMARQVAHEIKNPLTPMKLSVQHLQRAIKNKSENTEELAQRVSNTLIDQIDSLTKIANEFSNFAKMPKANNSVLQLALIIKSNIDLYNESDNIVFEFDDETRNSAKVFADKEQLLRVFTNLIKNAIQAIPENKQGKIRIKLYRSNDNIEVSITDNGKGIDDESRQRIFTPNFTTKTGGTGLGLAMVKNIVESFKGKIWFESQPGTGTTFFISLPQHDEEAVEPVIA